MPKREIIQVGELVNGVKYLGRDTFKNKRRYCDFECPRCGKTFNTILGKVKSGHTKSCGCIQKEVARQGKIKHGLYSHPLYPTWNGIVARTSNPKCHNYRRYGGRGITLCKDWQDCEQFIQWALSNGWKQGLQVDRIDNDKGYEPSNCRITTPLVNSNNSSCCNQCLLDGEIMSDTMASRKLGHHYAYVSRIRNNTRKNKYPDRLQLLPKQTWD